MNQLAQPSSQQNRGLQNLVELHPLFHAKFPLGEHRRQVVENPSVSKIGWQSKLLTSTAELCKVGQIATTCLFANRHGLEGKT